MVGRPVAWIGPAGLAAVAALAGFALWSLESASWSHATSRSVLEYDRTLLYLAILVLFACIGRAPRSVAALAFGIGGAFVVTSIVALGPFLLPHAFPVSSDFARDRLTWPTSYQNTTGLIGALGLGAAIHAACSRTGPALARVAGAAVVPAGVAVIWFSVSRGALLVAVVAGLAVVILNRSRGLLTGLPVVGAVGAATCLVCAHATGIAIADPGPGGIASGRHTATALALVALGGAVLRGILLLVDRGLAARKMPTPSRRVSGALAALAVVACVAGFFAVGGTREVRHGWREFTSATPVMLGASPARRFTRVGNNGRIAHYRVSYKFGFERHPFRGTGVGTFATQWTQHRTTSEDIVDAHSLYIEVLGELGVVGLALLLGALLPALVALAVRAWREGGAWIPLAASAIGWSLGAAFDWYWEMPAVTAWVFAAGGLALSRVPASAPTARRPVTWLGRAVAVAVVAAVALTPLAVHRSQRHLVAALVAFRAGDCVRADQQSLAADAALRSRPEPFELLSYCDVREGRPDLAIAAARAAHRRDPQDWEFVYDLALAHAAAGRDPRPTARAAVALDPREPLTFGALRAFDLAGARGWRAAALALPALVTSQPGQRIALGAAPSAGVAPAAP